MKVEIKKVSNERPNYYNVIVNGKFISEVRYPTTNPHLNGKSLLEVAMLDVNRVIESN